MDNGITGKFNRKNAPAKVYCHLRIKLSVQKKLLSSKVVIYMRWYEKGRVMRYPYVTQQIQKPDNDLDEVHPIYIQIFHWGLTSNRSDLILLEIQIRDHDL